MDMAAFTAKHTAVAKHCGKILEKYAGAPGAAYTRENMDSWPLELRQAVEVMSAAVSSNDIIGDYQRAHTLYDRYFPGGDPDLAH